MIEAPVERVWPFVGTQEGLRQWFAAGHLALEGRVNGHYEMRGVTPDGASFHMIGRVVTFDPPRKIEMTQRQELRDGSLWPEDSLISATLRDEGGRTRVTVVHSGFERLPADYRERTFEAYGKGWDDVMSRLRTLVAGSSFEKVDTVIVRVQDLERARAWYEEKLGLRVAYVGTDERLAVLRVGGETSVTLWQLKPGEQAPPGGTAAGFPIFYAQDLAAVRHRLTQRGVEVGPILGEPAQTQWFEFRDPDDNLLEVCHY